MTIRPFSAVVDILTYDSFCYVAKHILLVYTPESRWLCAAQIYFSADNGDGLSHQGVLLYGPPGTGKTLLARAVAHHTECTFIRVSGSELVQKFIGEGSRMVRELFVMARYEY